jgi:SAM-dependent methyltransferase
MQADRSEETRRGRRGLVIALAASGLAAMSVLAWAYLQISHEHELANRSMLPPDRIGSNAPFITTPDPVVEQMVELAELSPNDLAYDLGCGDGRIIITAALKTGCRGVGFDIDPVRVAEARENVKRHGVEHLVEIREQDVFTVDMSEANVALFYLLPWMTRKLVPQFQQMKPGSRLISHDFSLGDNVKLIPAEKTITLYDDERNDNHYIHRWIVPLTVPPERTAP